MNQKRNGMTSSTWAKQHRCIGKLFGNLNEMIGCARKQPLAGPACKGIAAFTWPGVR